MKTFEQFMEQQDPLKIGAKNAALRSGAFASKAFLAGWKKSPSNANNPESPYYDSGTKTPGV